MNKCFKIQNFINKNNRLNVHYRVRFGFDNYTADNQNLILIFILKTVIYTLPKDTDIKFDSELIVNELKDFKKHVGIVNLKPPVRVSQFLEDTINKIISCKS